MCAGERGGLGLEESLIFLRKVSYENRKYPIYPWGNRAFFSSSHIKRAKSFVHAMPVRLFSIIHIHLATAKLIPRLQHTRFSSPA
jgi:hypothetical protein